MRNDAINPEHYNRLNPQPKDVIREWGLNFNLGSAVKYISRAGHKDDIVQDLKKAQEFIQFEIDAIEAQRKNDQKILFNRKEYAPKGACEKILEGILGGLSVGCISISGKRKGKTDEQISEIVDKTLKDIVSGIEGVDLVDLRDRDGYTEVHITGTGDPREVYEYIERELRDRLAMVL